MTRARNTAEESKLYIAEKAKEIFIQKGYTLTSMEEIRINTGMSKGNIYYHFKSKEALFIYILELYMEDWINKWEKISSPLKSATEKLYHIAEHFAMDYENPLMKAAEEFSGSMAADPEIKAKFMEMTQMYIPIITQIAEEGIKNNEFKPADINHMTYILFGLMAGIGSICYSFSKNEIKLISSQAIDAILFGINK